MSLGAAEGFQRPVGRDDMAFFSEVVGSLDPMFVDILLIFLVNHS